MMFYRPFVACAFPRPAQSSMRSGMVGGMIAGLLAGLVGAAPVRAAPSPPDAGSMAAACMATAPSRAVGPAVSADWRATTAQAAWLDEHTIRVGQGAAQAAVAGVIGSPW